MSTSEQLHSLIVQHLQALKRELDRLSVREAAIERCRKTILTQRAIDSIDDEDEAFDAITANIDAIEYDLATFKDQLRERLAHLEHGLYLVQSQATKKNSVLFYQHVLDGAKLCVRDATVAREGYDELISNITEITHLREE